MATGLVSIGMLDLIIALSLAVPEPSLPPLPKSWDLSAMTNAVAWSPDGKAVFAADDDGYIRELDPATGAERRRFVPTREQLAAAKAKRPGRGDGAYLYTLDDLDALAVTADGKRLVSAGNDETIRVWDLATGEMESEIFWGPYNLDGFNGGIECMAMTPDGKRIVAGSWDYTLHVFDLDSGKGTILRGHDKGIQDVAISPDGTLIASASDDGTAKIWRFDGTLVATLVGHLAPVKAVAWSPDGKRLATGADGLWADDLGSPTSVDDNDLVQPHPRVKMVMLWDRATWKPVFDTTFAIDQVDVLAYSPDGKDLYASVFDNGHGYSIMRIDIATMKVVGRFLAGASNIASIGIRGDYLTCNVGYDVVVLDRKSGRELSHSVAPTPR